MDGFEWDAEKNKTNINKHGIDFIYACRIFEGPVLQSLDGRFDYGEDRYISIGCVDTVIILVVIHTDRQGKKRMISARLASRQERKRYEEKIQ